MKGSFDWLKNEIESRDNTVDDVVGAHGAGKDKCCSLCKKVSLPEV